MSNSSIVTLPKHLVDAAISLVARLEATQARERERELLATFEPIERPSEAGDNDYDIAPTRRVLGLDLLPSDPDLFKILKNQTWNYLRVSAPLK